MREWKCPNDDVIVPEGELCPVCGRAKPPTPTPPPPAYGWTCLRCGKKNFADAHFCQCGEPRPDIKPTPKPKPKPTPKPTPTPAGLKCPACGEAYEKGALFCKRCGKKLGSVYPPKPDSGWICKVCNTSNTGEAVFCKSCGAKNGTTPIKQPKPDINTELKEARKKVDTFRFLAVLMIAIVLCLFGAPYSMVDGLEWTVFSGIGGEYGDIEQICSIVLLVFVIAPLPFLFIKMPLTQKKLPIAISMISTICTSIYCCVIQFGSEEATGLPLLIIGGMVVHAVFTGNYVKAVKAMENIVLYRPTDLN